MTFTTSGAVGYDGPGSDPPDGNTGYFISRQCGAENGIADIYAPADALLGVFLDDTQPNLSAAPHPYTNAITAATSAPELKQPFFIGDGLTGTGTGSLQRFIVPAGATRPFRDMDGFQWNNNRGNYSVTVQSAPQLSIIQTANSQVQLSWPTNATGYSLEYVTNLASLGWTVVTNNPAVVADKFVLTIDPSCWQQYFKLSNP